MAKTNTTAARLAAKKRNRGYGYEPYTAEERAIVGMYRGIDSRWDRSTLLLLIRSMSWGSPSPEMTDTLTWKEFTKDFPKGARHG